LQRSIHHSTPSLKNIARHHHHLTDVVSSTITTRLHSTEDGDNQSEIAALEERLRELKNKEGESSPENSNGDKKPESIPMELSSTADDDDEDLPDGESEDSIMFSERWKEVKDDYVTKKTESDMSEMGGGIAKIGLALAFVVLLGLFSQVPVGEESLQRYQDVKGSTSRIDLGDLNPVE